MNCSCMLYSQQKLCPNCVCTECKFKILFITFFFPFLFLLSLQRSHKRKTQCLLLPVVSVHTPWRARRCMNVTNVQLLPTIKYSHVWFLCSDLIKYLSVNMYALSLKPQKYHLKFSIIFFL